MGGMAGGYSGYGGDEGESEEGQGGERKPRNDINEFAGKGEIDRWKLDSRPIAPKSPYAVQTTFVIPAILISGINSSLPGKIFGQVSQDVYDTATGKFLLIPQGTRLEGEYSSEVAYGQASILVAWQRLVFPDGKTMDIGAMPGSNSAGLCGVHRPGEQPLPAPLWYRHPHVGDHGRRCLEPEQQPGRRDVWRAHHQQCPERDPGAAIGARDDANDIQESQYFANA